MATAAFRVLDALFPVEHVTLQAHYDSSLAAISDGPLKEAGIDVGEAAAAAMLAEGHDGRLVRFRRCLRMVRASGSRC